MRRRLLATGLLFTVLAIGCLGLSDKRQIETWLVLQEDYYYCVSDYFGCLGGGSGGSTNDCGTSYNSCLEDAGEAAREADGKDLCITDWIDCFEVSESDADLDDCYDDLEDCAEWLQRDCEDECYAELIACSETAGVIFESDLDGLLDALDECGEEYYLDCVPECYEE